MAAERPPYIVGLDVGSTTVKAVVSCREEGRFLWKQYQRHGTRQAETVLEFFERMIGDTGVPEPSMQVFVTGSGGVGNLSGLNTSSFPSRNMNNTS